MPDEAGAINGGMARFRFLAKTFAYLLSATLFIILAGCVGSSKDPLLGPATGTVLGQLGGPGRLARKASNSLLLEKQGRETEVLLQQNASVHGLNLRLSPTFVTASPNFSQLAFAAYSFNIAGYVGPATLTSTWQTPPAAGTCFIGLSEWTADSWRWFSAPTDGSPLDATDLQPFADASGNVLAVVLTTGSVPCELAGIKIGNGNTLAHWHETQFNSEPLSISNLALLNINGVPGIFVTNLVLAAGREQILLLRASDLDATAVEPLIQVLQNPDLSYQLEITGAMIHGVPALAVLAIGTDKDVISYAQASDPQGNGWPFPTIIDPHADLDHPFLHEVDGHPAIVMNGYATHETPVYRRANDADGVSWPPSWLQLNTGAHNMTALDFDVIDGVPAIYAVEDIDGGMASYSFAQAIDLDGASWGPWYGMGTFPSGGYPYRGLAILDSGLPAAVFMNPGVYALRSGGPPHSAWGSPFSTLLGAPSTLDFEVIGGLPQVAQSVVGSEQLWFNMATGADVDSWEAPQKLAADVSGFTLDMAEIGGRPAIAVGNYNGGNRSQYAWLFMYY
jgi:hypothetical protein